MIKSVVIISSVSWHFSWQRHHDVSLGLAERGYRLIYIDPLPKRFPKINEWMRVIGRLIGSSRMSGKFSQDLPDDIYLILPLLLPDIGSFFSWLNRILFIPILKAKIDRICFKPIAVINYLPTISSVNLQNTLQPDVSIYDCTEDWDNFPSAKFTKIIEKYLVNHVSYVLTTSPFLYEKIKNNRSDVLFVLPAVHYSDFDVCRNHKANNKDEIKCAYFGGLREDNDLKLLAKVSEMFFLRIIGPVETQLNGFSQDVEFIGPVQYHELPKLLSDVDVLLLPYDKSKAHVAAIIPAKTFQCLATGKPTVVYGLDSLAMYSDYFCIANSHNDYLEKIRSVVVNDTEEMRNRRLEIAKLNDWEKRIDFFESLLHKVDEK